MVDRADAARVIEHLRGELLAQLLFQDLESAHRGLGRVHKFTLKLITLNTIVYKSPFSNLLWQISKVLAAAEEKRSPWIVAAVCAYDHQPTANT